MIKKACLLAFVVLASLSLYAGVTLPRIFGDKMVLQRDKPIAVWGWASAGERVTVNFHDQTKTAKADKQGRWSLHLDPESAGGPYQLTVSGKRGVDKAFSDVLVGEVWLASGQSNMEFRLQTAVNHDEEIAHADYPMIHLFQVKHAVADQPADDVVGSWQVCSPASVKGFSAVQYFFGRHLLQIGSWGRGTRLLSAQSPRRTCP